AFLSSIGAMTAKTCHKSNQTFFNDFDDFINDERGGKHQVSFHDMNPDLEIEAKTFMVCACSKKSNSFTILDLAKFIDTRFL
ncbi:unnamed protein product, partial [Rotaria sp. Silwood2]